MIATNQERAEPHDNETQVNAPLIDAHIEIVGQEREDILIHRVGGEEALGRLFQYDVQVATATPLDETAVVGAAASLMLLTSHGVRTVLGVVSECQYTGTGHGELRYELTLSPFTWPMTQRINSRIFQDLTTEQILTKLFRDHGLTDRDVHFALGADYKPRNFCVQYGESDWDFASRLMEAEGMHHCYVQRKGRWTLLVTDGPHGHVDCEVEPRARFHGADGMTPEPGVVYDLRFRRQIRSGRISQTDYAASHPDRSLATQTQAEEPGGEVFVYPGAYRDKELGQRLSQVRLEALRSGHEQGHGHSTRVDFAPGRRFELRDHPVTRFNRRWLITRVRVSVLTPAGAEHAAKTGANQGPGAIQPAFHNEFWVIPQEQSFRTECSTPRPRVQGPQSATVVGPRNATDGNNEIYTDKLGRVKVQFRWDREGKSDEASSCWVRVSQAWAGGGFGAMCVPRVGQEVIVSFLEGDPDQPVLTGRLYNGAAMPPLDLPRDKACTSIKSSSTPGGGGFNEIKFDDTRDQEKFAMRAQRDMSVTVLNDMSTDVTRDHALTVTRNRTIKVDGTHGEQIKGDVSLDVTEGTLTRTVAKDVTDTFKANHKEIVTKTYDLQAKKVAIAATQEITLSVGGNFIKIDKAGVTVWGTLVKIN